MRQWFAGAAYILALTGLAAPRKADAQLKKWLKAQLDSTVRTARGGAAAGEITTPRAADSEESLISSAPRNRRPGITGVWTGTLLAPQIDPNRFDFRIEVTDRDGSLSGQTRISVPGNPLRYAVYSIDGTLEDGLIKLTEVATLKEGSNVPGCARGQKPMTLIVRTDGTMIGEVPYGQGCGANSRLSLRQISTSSPELADAAAGEGIPPTPGGLPVTAAPAAPAAAMVTNPNVTGTWTGTATHPRGNPNRFKYRLDLTQRAGTVSGTVRSEVPDNPLQFWVYSLEGTVEEGIITLNTKQLLRHGSAGGSCDTRSVLILKTDGTLTGEWKGCGEGQIYVTKTR